MVEPKPVTDSSYLILAEKKYTDHLSHIYTLPIYSAMTALWCDSLAEYTKEKAAGKRSSALKIFQQNLKKIPSWNQVQLSQSYDAGIGLKYSPVYVKSLLEAVFVANIKLFSIFQKTSGVLHINIPEPRRFYHMCLIEAARRIYINPYLMENRDARINSVKIQGNIIASHQVIHDAIITCINDALPLDEMMLPKPEMVPVDDNPEQPEVELSDEEEDAALDGETFKSELDIGIPINGAAGTVPGPEPEDGEPEDGEPEDDEPEDGEPEDGEPEDEAVDDYPDFDPSPEADYGEARIKIVT